MEKCHHASKIQKYKTELTDGNQEYILATILHSRNSDYAEDCNLFVSRFLAITIWLLHTHIFSNRYFMPMVLSEFIGIFNEIPRNIRKGCYLGIALISMNFLNCLIAHQGNLYTKRLGMRVRVACCSLIYRKVSLFNRCEKISILSSMFGWWWYALFQVYSIKRWYLHSQQCT